MKIRSLLLVCSGNTCRSPMAAALLKRLWADAAPGWELEVHSAGTAALPGHPATEHAVQALKELEVDLAGHTSRAVEEDLLQRADLILVMTALHRARLLERWPALADRIHTLGEYAGVWRDVSDPFGGSLDEYRQTAADLKQLLRAVVERIRSEGENGA